MYIRYIKTQIMEITFGYNPSFHSFTPGTYLFAFKYLTRQIGWGIESTGKYFTYASPSSNNQIRDGWPTPFVKESTLSEPHIAIAQKQWNIVSIISNHTSKPFTNIAYYMAQDHDNEYGHGQMGSDISRVGSVGSKWQQIDEKSSSDIVNIIKFH